MKNRWHHVPVLHTLHMPEKKANWLELFYDLIYVAAFIQLGNAFSHDISLFNFLKITGIFVPLWLTWTGYTYYSNRYTVDDLLHRMLVFLHMFAIGAMAIAIPWVLKGSPLFFGAAYAVAQLIIALLYLRTYVQQENGKAYTRYWGSVFFLSAAVWAASLPFSGMMYWGWALGACLILIAPALTHARALVEAFPFDHEHLSERYGLLTIIVLGESFVKVLSELSGGASGIVEVFQASFALLITCCIWWLYFDDVAGTALKKSPFAMVFWLLAHLPLQLSIVLLGVGIKKTLNYGLLEVLPLKYALLLTGALGTIFLATALIDAVTLRNNFEINDQIRVYIRFFSGLVILLIGQTSQSMQAGWLLGACLFICVFQIFFDIWAAPEQWEAHAHDSAPQLTEEHTFTPVAFETDPVRKGVPSALKKDLYFYFLDASWGQLIVSLFFLFLLSNVFFASLYLLQPHSINNATLHSFADAFFFSVQTMSTIGYGALSPQGHYANSLVTLEAAFGLLGIAVVTGLVFAKLSRPNARIVFSRNMLIQSIQGQRYLVFRMGNARGNDIVEAKVSVTLLVNETTQEGQQMSRMYDLSLVRSQTPFFKLSWLVMHPLTPESPFFELGFNNPALQRLVVTVSGHDSIFSSTIYTRQTYGPQDILEDRYFEDMVSTLPDGRILMDFDKFHQLKPGA